MQTLLCLVRSQSYHVEKERIRPSLVLSVKRLQDGHMESLTASYREFQERISKWESALHDC